MACPDRYKDRQIIAEIERRKSLVEEKNSILESFHYIEYGGLLTDIQFIVDLGDIISIERIGENQYRAKVKIL